MYSKSKLKLFLENQNQPSDINIHRVLLTQSIDLLNVLPWKGSKCGNISNKTIELKLLELLSSITQYYLQSGNNIDEILEFFNDSFVNNSVFESQSMGTRIDTVEFLISSIANNSARNLFDNFVSVLNSFGIPFHTLYNINLGMDVIGEEKSLSDLVYYYTSNNANKFLTYQDVRDFLKEVS